MRDVSILFFGPFFSPTNADTYVVQGVSTI